MSEGKECGKWPSNKLPCTWVWADFYDVWDDQTDSKKKLPQKKYNQTGLFAVVDQGEELVGGYSDDKDLICETSLPAIIFGDHTRAVKFINFPFIQGADGVRVLASRACLNERYSYFALKSIELPDKGYSRHFKFLKSSKFPLPPLNEQKRIADKLDTVLAAVGRVKGRLEKAESLLKRFRQSVLNAATTGKLTEEWRAAQGIEDEWDEVKLGDLSTTMSYGSSKKSEKIGQVPVLRMGNIQSGKLDWGDLVFSNDKSEIAKYYLEDGDVLFNRTNSPELVGKSAVFKGLRKAIYAGYLIRVKTKPNLLPDYLNYCLNSPYGKDYCQKVKTDGVSQSNINAKKLAAFLVPLPPPVEQQEIVCWVERLFEAADRIEERLGQTRKRVDRLESALLAKAFRGELVPQDPNDEPASELLKRIKAERAEKETNEKPRRRKRAG